MQTEQWECTPKGDMTSPMVAIKSVFITATSEPTEIKVVALVSLQGAFLHATNDEEATMKLQGRLAELIMAAVPQIHWKYITKNKPR